MEINMSLKKYLAGALAIALVMTAVGLYAPVWANEGYDADLADVLTEEVDVYIKAIAIDETVVVEYDEAFTPTVEMIATGTVGAGGAPWTLNENGVITVGGGTVDANNSVITGPWSAYSAQITEIIFTEPVQAIRLQGMFRDLTELTNIQGLELMDTSNVTDMTSMFSNTRVTYLDLSTWDTSNVTNMNAVFSHASNLITLDISSFDTSNVTNMAAMFSQTHQLVGLDVSHFDTSNVTNMGFMFNQARSLTALDLSNFDTSNVTNMNAMFQGTIGLTALDLSNFNTSSVTNMNGMFSGNGNLTTLDVSNFDTSNVVMMTTVFVGTTQLVELDLSTWSMENAITTSNMFGNMHALRTLTLGSGAQFPVNPNLPTIPVTSVHSGYWQHIGTGTATNPNGAFAFTSAQLWSEFDGDVMAGTFVWQPANVEATTHTVTFNLHGGAGDFPVQNVEDGQLAVAPTAMPTRNGYTFVGWFSAEAGGTAFDFTTPITEDTVVHARWEADDDNDDDVTDGDTDTGADDDGDDTAIGDDVGSGGDVKGDDAGSDEDITDDGDAGSEDDTSNGGDTGNDDDATNNGDTGNDNDAGVEDDVASDGAGSGGNIADDGDDAGTEADARNDETTNRLPQTGAAVIKLSKVGLVLAGIGAVGALKKKNG